MGLTFKKTYKTQSCYEKPLVSNKLQSSDNTKKNCLSETNINFLKSLGHHVLRTSNIR